jgi:hypothetical protein
MAGFESVFQRMDETIVDVCLRQLTWDDLPPSLWQAGSHDIFEKTDRPLAKPFLWKAWSHDIFAKT